MCWDWPFAVVAGPALVFDLSPAVAEVDEFFGRQLWLGRWLRPVQEGKSVKQIAVFLSRPPLMRKLHSFHVELNPQSSSGTPKLIKALAIDRGLERCGYSSLRPMD